MNFVTFVFSLLLIFAFGTFVVLEKQGSDRRIRETYLGHIKANRKILSKVEGKTYNSLRSTPKEKGKHKSKKRRAPELNPECSKLNLWPLVQEGKEAHPFLYEMTLKLLDTFYGKSLFQERPQEKALFLNALLKKSKDAIQNEQFSLEKLALGPKFKESYYRMLKGTKTWDPEKEIGYPSLLDVIKVEETSSQVCICHAHIGQLIALFGKKPARVLCEELYREEPPPLTKELLMDVFSKAHQVPPGNEFFDQLEMGKSSHILPEKMTFVASDDTGNVKLRKTIYTQKNRS